MVGAVALANRAAKSHDVIGRVSQVHTRGYETSVDVTMVPAKSAHQRKPLTYFICILGIDTWCGLVKIEAVMIQTDACRETVMLIEVGLEQQRGIAIALVCVILFLAVERILVM